MKSFINIIFLFFSLLVCVRAFGVWAGGCKVDEDCGDTECCVKQFGGYMGQCLRRPQEGENCIPENKYNKIFQQATCPCAEGLQCSAGTKNKFSGMNYSSPPKCSLVTEVTEPASTE